ncbi:nucleotide-binding universal stress UspA family protein [Natronocella acetinitrilica]|uniref:Nucleotide-binding universal stress UspA family protein n=1 Tax=Natronocella acetinitrilica TaxID=414046 RepID=A0AAE3GAE2_9GAMM|nr:universal stress protein [Natronocella acetinitrilica]MCP1676692.1 nucleotide-binding universal stress UspA family protein [Natronocella acetinitrilica]
MFRHALVAVDFSPAWPVLKARLEDLRALGAEQATLVYVLSSRYPAVPEVGHREHYEERLRGEAAMLAEMGYSVDTQVRVGEPGMEVVAAAREVDADLILLGSQGHTRVYRFFLGSTAMDAARLTSMPLWLEPVGEGSAADRSGILLLATDGSPAAEAAEQYSRAIAPRMRQAIAATATCASEGCDREIADARAHLATVTEGITNAEPRVLDGDPRTVIVELARHLPAELTIIGKRGRGAIPDLLLGSTAEAVCHGAHRPVLLVPMRKGAI